MKAAIFEGVGKISTREIKRPQPNDGELLLKVMACAVCGTDVRIFNHGHSRITPPFTIGHEIAGIIEEGKGQVSGFKKGDRVVIAPPGMPCGECYHCNNSLENLCPHRTSIAYEFPGGFSEYMIIPRQAIMKGNVIRIPNHISFDEACLTEPLACCINGQKSLKISPTTSILIIGSGPIGLMHMQLAKAKGAWKTGIVDIAAPRLKKAEKFEPDFIIDSHEINLAEEINRITMGVGINVVIVACSSKEAVKQAFEVVSRGGEILLFAGLPKEESELVLDMNYIHYNELKIAGSFASTNSKSEEALQYIKDGKINLRDLITHSYQLDQIEKAIQMACSTEALKVIVNPNR